MTISFGFEVIGTYPIDLEIDEEELQEEGWDEMTTEEKIEWLRDNFEDEMKGQAESECEFSTGELDYIQINEEEHWIH